VLAGHSRPSSGNCTVKIEDPVTTRSYPLKNNLWIHTQSTFPPNNPLGNAYYSYGIRIYEKIPANHSTTDGILDTPKTLILIDGTGREFDFEEGRPAIFKGDITRTQTGFSIQHAGSPENIHERGQFSYTFNQQGQLISITDPNRNQQQIAYSGTVPTEVVDIASNKRIRFESSNNLITKIIENGGGATTELSYTSTRQLASVIIRNPNLTIARRVDFSYYSDTQNLWKVVYDTKTSKEYVYQYLSEEVPLGMIKGEQNFKYEYAPPETGFTYKTARTDANGNVTN
jgi:YD repeat-containing protein